ncbi:MAG: ABC transporter permease [Spirochaetales bacterium]|nr:ABC transporter permease [Spirochaetales bacterium]
MKFDSNTVKLACSKTDSIIKKYGEKRRYRKIVTVVVVILIIAVIYIFVPRFFNPRNLKNILVQSSTLGLMAIGMTLVYLTGGMDLSIPSVMALSGIIGAILMQSGVNPVIAAIITILAGGAVGAINGLSVSALKMIPFVVTLAMMQVMSGVSTWITNSVSVVVPLSYINIVLFKIAGLPLPVYIFIVITAISTFLCKSTLSGRWLYAVGINMNSAKVCKIPADRIVFFTYVFSGSLAGVTGILLTARLGAAGPLMGSSNVILDVMSAAVVGGVSIYGGVGSPLGAALGAVIITVLNNVLNLLRVDFFPAQVIKGVLIIVFVALDSFRRKK